MCSKFKSVLSLSLSLSSCWSLTLYIVIGFQKLTKTLEEYVSSTPQIAEDGGIVLGSKKTTAYLVDAKTGRLIYTYRMPDSSIMTEDNSENTVFFNNTFEEFGFSQAADPKADELPLYITRTDYALTSFAPNSNKVLWNVTVAEVGAAFLCQESDNSYDGAILDSGSSAPDFKMPLPCQSRALVFRFRNHDMLEPFIPPELPEVGSRDMVLPAPSQAQMLPSQPHTDRIIEYLPFPKDTPKSVPSLPAAEVMPDVQEVKIPGNGQSRIAFERITGSPLFVAALVCFLTFIVVRKSEQPSNSSSGTISFKRKKNRKVGKNGSNSEKKEKDTMPNGNGMGMSNDDDHLWRNLSEPFSSICARRIGKLLLTANEIAKGSNGTVVLEGIYEGRPVAVKRLVRAHHDIAFKEIQNLIASDRHPNIVRWFGVEQDQDFVYLSLERCNCSLNDFVQLFSDASENLALSKNLDDQDMAKYKAHMDSVKVLVQDTVLWKANGYPSPVLLKLMRDLVSGLVHLHELGIIHRDIKPQNVLIIKDKYLCAKLSDMGISKRLTGDMASLGQHATGCGSSGWQAPEQLLLGRQTRAVDLFSIGCVLFFCVTGGSHPFGDRLERDVNIVKNQVDLFLVEHIPEAKELFSLLLSHNPEMRPTAVEVLAHPLFWDAEMRLSFLRDTSDRVELEDRENNSQLLNAIESTAAVALGGKWDEKMESAFLNNIGRYRRYKFDSVRDLLRVMRNKLNHYRELPKEIQEILGSVPEGFDNYFASRFPNLLIEVYKVMSMHCKEEELFVKYFKCSVV
ncbi:OLC1v1010490C5 [Oldenlandia corymbosa var. corymbosa]|uniref:non-specific serine/threonine protein kinase n=1 Tax=Oldenlandia corymbosa var. corymbosa TaxID=529605 RepID=A0AAV1DTX8_OLDCO|nr:OLC1v1010490C5 [Oldenlandia corymbosa var. corymbosa]